MNSNNLFRLKMACVLVLLALAPLSAWAKDPVAPKPPALPKPYADMADDLKLTDDQKAQLISLDAAKHKAASAWVTENQETLKPAQAAVAAAKTAGDKDALDKAQAALKEVQAPKTKIEHGFDKQMQDLLTPEQHATFVCGTMSGNFLHDFAKALNETPKLELTTDQQARIKALCLAQAKSVEALKPDDTGGLKAIHKDVKKQIVDTILTADQQAALSAKNPPKK